VIVFERILFVDDEQGVLDGFERLLRKDFAVTVALGGLKGLEAIQVYGPFAIVISDMRMPGMSGAEFLAQVMRQAPDTVRMLLTGYTDLSAAIDAVNEGNIFRFLTKPCAKDVLINAINIGLEKYRSVCAEKELLKKIQKFENSVNSWDTEDLCQWDNFEGPTGLPGPTQAREFLTPLFGFDTQCYVVLLKLTVLHTLETRYGEEIAGDYLNLAAQFLMQSLRAEDKLFHWERDVLMAVVRRRVSPAAMQMEITRLTTASREHIMQINGKSIMIASPIASELLPVSQFYSLNELLAAFELSSQGGILGHEFQ
jgi:FixJ family two-component response regulator